MNILRRFVAVSRGGRKTNEEVENEEHGGEMRVTRVCSNGELGLAGWESLVLYSVCAE